MRPMVVDSTVLKHVSSLYNPTGVTNSVTALRGWVDSSAPGTRPVGRGEERRPNRYQTGCLSARR